MSEYITKDQAEEAAWSVIESLGYSSKHDTGWKLVEELRGALDDVPAADVAPVRHGRWVLIPTEEMAKRGAFDFLWASGAWLNYECSSCGETVHNALKGTGDARTTFCPNCGALMDREGGG